jgi:hypothetical protein
VLYSIIIKYELVVITTIHIPIKNVVINSIFKFTNKNEIVISTVNIEWNITNDFFLPIWSGNHNKVKEPIIYPKNMSILINSILYDLSHIKSRLVNQFHIDK